LVSDSRRRLAGGSLDEGTHAVKDECNNVSAQAQICPDSVGTLIKTYRRRYTLGLLVIAVLCTLSFVVVEHLLSVQKSDGAVINVAGKQRMLSQRIALLTRERLALLESPEANIGPAEDLAALARLMTEDHLLLLDFPVTSDSSELIEMYYSEPVRLSSRVQAYAKAAKQIAQTTAMPIPSELLDQFSASNVLIILKDLDQEVQHYEALAFRHTRTLEQVELVLWVFVLIVLVVEAKVVFRPMASVLRGAYLQLVQKIEESEALRIEAQQAAVAKSHFLANMSHEIRTPMNGVLDEAATRQNDSFDETGINFS
jgi:signal transduction histidine kinase